MRNLMSAPPTDRVGRYPKHTFRVNAKPFTAQPFMIARVLPGETLKNLYFEARLVTSPVQSPIIGWKQEFFYYYVRITDLLNDAIRDMFIDPNNADLGASQGVGANDDAWYCAKGAINWTEKAVTRIVDTYFRDDGEVAGDYLYEAGGYPIVQIRENTFMDSLTDEDNMPVGDAVADATTLADLDRLYDAFEQLRALGIASMTYEDWLRSNGIAIPGKDENKPELLQRWSDFQYPSNHIGTSGSDMGIPTSAVSWVFRNGNRDPKFFKEPGFIVGIAVTRPKVYFGGLAGSACGFAARAWDWMPNYLRGMPETQLKHFAVDMGPLGDRTTLADGYWLDMRDELLYGDQFHNVKAFGADPSTDYGNHLFPLPAGADIKFKYPTKAMIDGLFKEATGVVSMDGFCSLSVKGHEVDYTQGNVAEV